MKTCHHCADNGSCNQKCESRNSDSSSDHCVDSSSSDSCDSGGCCD